VSGCLRLSKSEMKSLCAVLALAASVVLVIGYSVKSNRIKRSYGHDVVEETPASGYGAPPEDDYVPPIQTVEQDPPTYGQPPPGSGYGGREGNVLLLSAAFQILKYFGILPGVDNESISKVVEKSKTVVVPPNIAKGIGLGKAGRTVCNANPANQGVCESTVACLADKGKSVGYCSNCAGCSTCCQYTNDCQSSTDKIVSYFESDGYPDTRRHETHCQLTINVREEVTQIRLDFMDFELPDPVGGECRDTDHMEIVNNLHPVGVLGQGQSRFCGLNTGQHLYMEADPNQLVILRVITSGVAPVPFTSYIASDPNVVSLASDTAYRWRIKITQIMGDSDSAFMQSVKAPTGCRQYFTATKGSLISFNFDGRSQILANQDYAVCVRNPDRTCGITFTALSFGLPATEGCRSGKEEVDTNGKLCCTSDENKDDPGFSFFGIMGAKQAGDRYHFCGKALGEPKTLKAMYKGPLNFRVRTGPMASSVVAAQADPSAPCGRDDRDCAGFRLVYDVQTGTC